MMINRPRANVELPTNFLAGSGRGVLNHELSNFFFSRGQKVKSVARELSIGFGGSRLTIRRESGCDAFDQSALTKRFFQKIDGPGFDCLHRFRHAPLAGNKNNRDQRIICCQMFLQVQTIQAGHAVIQNDAARKARVIGV